MKLHQLRDVIAVADFGSVRAAARHLNIAQSAVTKSVQQLERELDVPLFERQRRGTVLTPLGALFVQRARSASHELTRAQDELRQHRGLGVGQVTLSLSTVPHLSILPSVIRPFTLRYPEVRLTVLEALGFHTAEPQLRNGAVEVYIGVAPSGAVLGDYQVEPLFDNERCVIARTGNALASSTTLLELVDARWISSSATTFETGLAPLFLKHAYKVPEHVTYAGSILSQVVLLMHSDMLMIGPSSVVSFAPYEPLLVQVPIKEELDAPPIVMIRRASMPLTPAAEYFCDLVRRTAVALQREKVDTRSPKLVSTSKAVRRSP